MVVVVIGRAGFDGLMDGAMKGGGNAEGWVFMVMTLRLVKKRREGKERGFCSGTARGGRGWFGECVRDRKDGE